MAVLKNSLNHSTTISVHAERAYGVWLLLYRCHNEFDLFMRHLFDALLDHVIPILVKDAVED
jgi:hypothetical protein